MSVLPSRPPVAPPLSSSLPSGGSGPLTPSSDQIVVLYVIVAMAVVIFGFWNVPVVRNLINPLKLFTIGWHELCHISAAIMSGGRILKITIDPHVGGATIVEGGSPGFVLSSGYIGSTLLGGVFVLAGWDTLVAKVMSFVLGVGLVLPLVLVRDKLPAHWLLVCRSCPGSPVVLPIHWGHEVRTFNSLNHYSYLYILLLLPRPTLRIGDVADDRFFHKSNDSDATQFSLLYPRIGAHTHYLAMAVWATFWIIFQLGFLAGFAILGIFAFKSIVGVEELE
ncbi:hypothetical protein JR316_0008172 [Psilocybe cubensis]|uniref:Uncharacterized protein n=1 Tax=Psilocybe cubensis TaxID=181762 RepID=A0ACB8GW35_PSICU|nr:hypothetical protein JR316_0008172 [Psilocybe cubensis]KAH9479577.1 hypothetical protein JR316_0008172 [Psilocybe cubensis]